MKLVPKNEVRIEYVGVPRLDHERVQELYSKIQSKLIDASDATTKVEMVLVSRHLERIGDLLCKIGARIVFVDEGRRVWIK